MPTQPKPPDRSVAQPHFINGRPSTPNSNFISNTNGGPTKAPVIAPTQLTPCLALPRTNVLPPVPARAAPPGPAPPRPGAPASLICCHLNPFSQFTDSSPSFTSDFPVFLTSLSYSLSLHCMLCPANPGRAAAAVLRFSLSRCLLLSLPSSSTLLARRIQLWSLGVLVTRPEEAFRLQPLTDCFLFCATCLFLALDISAAMEKRNSLTKSTAPPPPSSSEEETASSEEETEDDEQATERSGLDSGSAESADASKKKPVAVPNPKPAAKAAITVKAVKAVKAASTAAATSKVPSTTAMAANTSAAAARAASPTTAAPAAKASDNTAASAKAANTAAVAAKAANTAAVAAKAANTAVVAAKVASASAAAKGADTAVAPTPGKRLRETNGKKEKATKEMEEEPSKKRKKTEVATPAPKAAPKVVEQSEKKVSSRAAKGKSIAPSKEKKQDVEEETKKPSSKRKAKSSGAADVDMLRAEDEASQKPKMTARPWTPEEEMALSKEVQKDRINGVYGSSLPSAKSDPYWENLVGRCPFMLQYEEELRIERLREKVRRMRLRYEDLDKRHKAGEAIVYRKPHEKDLWPIWKAIWGPIKVDGDDEEEEDEEGEKDEEGEEDESEDNGLDEEKEAPEEERPPSKSSKAVQKKKVAGGLSTDGDEGSPIVPNVPESAVPTVSGAVPTLTDDLRAENLALLRDMKSTCLKMVEEARTQCLFIAETILGDARVKTIEMIDEGRVKSILIMEELRIFAERVNAASLGLAAQGTGPGASSSSADPLRKEIAFKWDEQKVAEEMLLLQRLQLVQDEARMYQEAILKRLRAVQPAQPAQQN